jgi:hypothetical protein
MPLLPGTKNIGANISELTHHGSRPRSRDQIIAIALSHARRHPRAAGGPIPNLAVPLLPQTLADKIRRIEDLHRENTEDRFPSFQRILQNQNKADGGSTVIDRALRLARGGALQGYEKPAGQSSPYGFTAGIGGGRTDKNDMTVGGGSYVLPADVVAGLGDGNSLSGAHVWELMLSSMPWGISKPKAAGQRGLPPAPHYDELMRGITGTQKQPTLAGLLDIFIKQKRGETIEHLKGLKGPVGSANSSVGHT